MLLFASGRDNARRNMPDDTTADWETEYKKLQRKLNRKDKSGQEMTRRVAEQDATLRRLEAMQETLLDFLTVGDDEAVSRASAVKQTLHTRRQQDTDAAQLESRISSILDSHDVDFDSDPRLEEARRLVSEVNRTGNLELASTIETVIAKAMDIDAEDGGSDGDGSTIEQAVREAVAEDRRTTGRVDIGQTTVTNSNQVRRSDFVDISPTSGYTAMREKLNKHLDSLGI